VITKLNQDQLLALGFSKGAAAQVLRERETIERDWSEKILWSYFQDRWKITDEIWRNVLNQAVTLTALPARIDTVVTTDIHRLIRMPETLNGKTGLRATMLDLDQLEEFDPFDQPIAFQGKQTVFVNEAPEIRIREQKFGPFNQEKIELPLSGAVLLIAKGVAVPVN
jgi:DNA primase catalytic subunit